MSLLAKVLIGVGVGAGLVVIFFVIVLAFLLWHFPDDSDGCFPL